MKIIAFGHRSRMGKDTCAQFLSTHIKLQNKYHVVTTSFAHRLKVACHYIWGWAGVQMPEYYEQNPEQRTTILQELDMTVVDLWIRFGTPMCRKMVHDATWVNNLLGAPPKCDVLLITDLRFPNEGQAILKSDGLCVRVTNDRIGYRDSIADEALEGWTGWTNVIENNGTLKELYASVIDLGKKAGVLHG